LAGHESAEQTGRGFYFYANVPQPQDETWSQPEKGDAVQPAAAEAAPPLSQILAHLLLPFSTPSGPTSKDQTEDAAASTTVVDAAEAIAGGVAKAAGATGGRPRLPPSKYASPKPFDSRPRESQPTNRPG